MEEPYTFNDLAWDRLCDVIRTAVGESEWHCDGFREVLAGLSSDLNEAINSDGPLAAAMNQRARPTSR
jgi:hypothetical protein